MNTNTPTLTTTTTKAWESNFGHRSQEGAGQPMMRASISSNPESRERNNGTLMTELYSIWQLIHIKCDIISQLRSEKIAGCIWVPTSCYLPIWSWQKWVKGCDSHTRSERLDLEVFSLKSMVFNQNDTITICETVQSVVFGFPLTVTGMHYFIFTIL